MTESITVAKPHTIKKFELIEQYVDEWARKILGFNGKNGYRGSEGIIYIDCMSNSGVYQDEDGNRVEGTALRVVKRLNSIITNYPNKKCVMFFNDRDSGRIKMLEEEIEKYDPKNVVINISKGDCNEFLKSFDFSAFKRYNILLVYDPYIANIDWSAISPFLNTWGEVIINHMVSDTARGASLAKKQEVIHRYEETYQKSIQDIISIGTDRKELDSIIVNLIKENIHDNSKNPYVASFPFFNRVNGLVYSLIHCSKNVAGTVLFKKIAWKTFGDKSSLKNTHGSQDQYLFNFDNSLEIGTPVDDYCYYISDIAKYIYDKYHVEKEVSLKIIYNDLAVHPIFPSEGYLNEIKRELKKSYGVSFTRETVRF